MNRGRWVWATEGDFLALEPTTFVLTEKRNLLLLRAVHAELYQGREPDEAVLAHYEAMPGLGRTATVQSAPVRRWQPHATRSRGHTEGHSAVATAGVL